MVNLYFGAGQWQLRLNSDQSGVPGLRLQRRGVPADQLHGLPEAVVIHEMEPPVGCGLRNGKSGATGSQQGVNGQEITAMGEVMNMFPLS